MARVDEHVAALRGNAHERGEDYWIPKKSYRLKYPWSCPLEQSS